jgi:hypothetical protein
LSGAHTAAAERRHLLDRRVAAELPEQRRPTERERTADGGDDEQLDETEGEDSGAAHKTVITARCW